MSIFRFGKAIVRSFIRSVDVLKQGESRANNFSWHANGSKKVYQGQPAKHDCVQYHHPSQSSGNLLSRLTRNIKPNGFASARAKIGIEYGSFLKGHRIFRLLKRCQKQAPLFAFLGFVCTDIGPKKRLASQQEEAEFSELLQWMQRGIETTQKEELQDKYQNGEENSLKLSDYKIGKRLGKKSCNSAVYEATRTKTKQRFAVKMLFNLYTNSNSADIEKEFAKEKKLCLINKDIGQDSQYTNLPVHPNIIPIIDSFVDDVPCLPDATTTYPDILPSKYNGMGRNKTMFLIMPRLECTLQDYLTNHCPNEQTSMLLLLQLLQAVAHLEDNQVAHRDMKTDNILVDLSYHDFPRLVLCDFGCSFAERESGFKMPLVTEQTDRGGNSLMMAPEVINAKAGKNMYIDYSKSDAWSCGAVAYELFGQKNPFVRGGLVKSSYQDNQLPKLNTSSKIVSWVVKKLLQRSTCDRMTARHASIVLSVKLFAPSCWFLDDGFLTQLDIIRWLIKKSSKFLQKETVETKNIEKMIMSSFLQKATVDEVSMSVGLLRQLHKSSDLLS